MVALKTTGHSRVRAGTRSARYLIRAGVPVLLWFCSISGLLQAAETDSVSAGPFYDEFPLTLATGHRTEILGPLFYSEEKETRHTWAFPPLFSHTEDPETESEEYDFLYPVITFDRFGQQYRWQLFQLLNFAGGPTQQETNRHRINLFPLYMQQRSSDPSENYTAVLPFYGHLKNRLFRDEVSFVMLPFYVESRKKDIVTDNYVYPFFHLRRGDGLEGWQFWPITGHEHKGVTFSTNAWGDLKTVGGHDKMFVLWPFFYNERTGLGTENPQWRQGSIPAYDIVRSPNRDSTTVLWPFFSFIDEREKNYREWQTPWPFVIVARGEGKTTTRFFPLFSHAGNGTNQSDFYMWPVYMYKRVHADPLDRHRARVLFFLYSDTVLKNTETGAWQRRVDLWPFFSHHREFDGSTRLQILAVLEPYLPNNKSIERDYSPLWSLWRSEKNPRTGASSQSLLWNLYRHDASPASNKTSLLFGLFQWRTTPESKEVRLFYFPLSKNERGGPQGVDALKR